MENLFNAASMRQLQEQAKREFIMRDERHREEVERLAKKLCKDIQENIIFRINSASNLESFDIPEVEVSIATIFNEWDEQTALLDKQMICENAFKVLKELGFIIKWDAKYALFPQVIKIGWVSANENNNLQI